MTPKFLMIEDTDCKAQLINCSFIINVLPYSLPPKNNDRKELYHIISFDRGHSIVVFSKNAEKLIDLLQDPEFWSDPAHPVKGIFNPREEV